MNVRIVLFVLSMALVHCVKGQEIQLGAKVNTGVASFNLLSNPALKTSFGGGLFAAVKLSKIGFQIDAMYQNMGAIYDGKVSLNNPSQINLSLAYLQVPVVAKWHFLKVLNVQTGPYFGVLLNANDPNLKLSKDLYNPNDVGWIGGLGVAFWKLHFDVRYQAGFTEIEHSINTASKPRNQSFLVGVGYSFL